MSHAVGGSPQYPAFVAEPLEPRWLLAADLVISEFMASNDKFLKDSEGDYSDWIEINNRGDAPADLNGWYLTDKSTDLTEWRFPQRMLAPGEYLLVFASGKDMTTAGGELHTGFKLDSDGEYLALVRPDGTTVQFEYAPKFPSQNSNISYGLAPGSDERVFFTKPTPRVANQLSSSEPVFSQQSRTFFGTLTVSLSTTSPGAQIRYTLDQTVPSATSPLYTGPITLTRTTTLRARVFESGIAPGPVASQCYFALDTNVKSFRSNLPVIVIDSFGKPLGDTSLTSVAAAFIETGADGYADITDRVDFAGRGGFRLRGQSSQGFPKAPYALETWDESNNDRSVSILGMPAESDWILYNPYSEKSLMQNYLAYMWSNRMGDYAVRTRYVEVFVNTDGGSKISYSSDYVGVYILMEKIKVDKNRVDIAPLTPTDNTEPDITGGYIFKKDKFDANERGFTTSTGQVFLYADPGETELTAQQKAYLTGYINSFEQALYGPNFKDPLVGYAKYIDVDSWIDAHIMVELTKNIDGFRLSTYWYKDRGGKIKMGPIWDYNLSMGNADYYTGSSPTGWYYSQLSDYDYPYWRRLFQDPDFQQRWIDRWQELRRDALSTDRITADIDALVNLLSDGNGNYPVGPNPTQPANNPVVRNFKRWNVLGTYLWPNGYVGRGWMDDVNWMKNFLKTRLSWIDSQYQAAPVLSRAAGTITSSFKLTISNASKPIYYTLDGSDPRLPGGALNPKARLYSGSIDITKSTRIKARVYSGGNWSGLTDATYAFDTGLRITELMYHPAPPPAGSPYTADDFEYIELTNTSATTQDLWGMQFTNGISLTCPQTSLAPGARAVIVSNKEAFQSRYGTQIPIIAVYTGNLSKAGETIRLEGALGQLIEEFTYKDGWYSHTDGGGFSLVPIDPKASGAALSDKAGWRPSDRLNGNPAAADTGLAPNSLVINEILAHTDQPSGDWIELYNTTDQPLDISGWFLSDSSQDLSKYQIPAGTVISAHGYVVFNQLDHFGHSGLPTAFAFSELGEAAYLSSSYQGQLGGYRDSVDFAASDREVPFGHYTKSTGGSDFVAMSRPTPGEANASPLVGPIVINEIMYAPAMDGDEYIELANLTSSAFPLYDPLHPQNAWKFSAGVTYTFPTLATIPALSYALVVNIDPAQFRSKYRIPDSVPIYGPYAGALDNAGEKLELSRPGDPELNGFVPYYQVDRINYDSATPWPTLPSATGPSLARVSLSAYGNDPANWTAERTGGSPGLANLDRIAPGVTINLSVVSPNPGPIEQLTFHFSEPIVGLDLSDLILRRYGEVVPWSTSTRISSLDGQNWVLSGLAEPTQEAGAYSVTLTAHGSNITDLSGNALPADTSVSFTNSRLVISNSAGSPSLLKVDGTDLQIFRSGLPVESMPLSDLQELYLSGGNIRIEGTLGSLVGAELASVAVQVTGDATNPATLLLTDSQQWSSLTLLGTVTVNLARGGENSLTLSTLSLSPEATLNLADNDLIIHATPQTRQQVLATISTAIQSARGSDATWLHSGVGSSAAHANKQTGLAILLNEKNNKPLYTTFAGQPVTENDILVKYTWNGDVNLDGVVDASDYFLVDSGFITQQGQYRNGDLNLDGVVDAADYFLIDSAFIAQAGPMYAKTPSPIQQLFSTKPLL